MGGKDRLPITDAATMVAERVARARAAQAAFDGATQEEVDEVVTAVGWAIVDPEHNAALADTAPSPKGASTLSLLLSYVHAELDRVGVGRDLVQQLPAPTTREMTNELMRQVDLVVATGSQTNVRAAYASGTPAIGVGAGNVAAIVDETADLADAADKIARSKMFDNATSCSSENSVIAVAAIAEPLLAALTAAGGARLEPAEASQLERAMF